MSDRAVQKLDDVDWLREQYLEKGRSAREISRELDTTYYWVDKALQDHEIPKRSQAEAVSKARGYPHAPINLGPDKNAKGPHWRWVDTQSNESVYVQQLLAIAKGNDPHLVFSPHSRIEFKDNRRDHLVTDNIEFRGYWWQNKDELKEALETHQTIGDVADAWDTSHNVITDWMGRHTLERQWDSDKGEWKVVDYGDDGIAQNEGS